MNNGEQIFKERACAKINLFLYITGKRPDGFHDIYTFFVPITLFDNITITPADKTELFCSEPDIPTDEDNIILKTDSLLRREYGLKDNFIITLEKGIPHGAGLGGGSSDAACYLKLVNRGASLGLSVAQMKDIMARIGSDTAFFINPTPCLARGRGEILEEISDLPDMFFIIINPHIHISTKKVYENKNLVLTDLSLTPNLGSGATFKKIVSVMKNDLEGPVFKMSSHVKELAADMKERTCGQALMSGSGSTVFAVYDDADKRDNDFRKFKQIYNDYFVCKAEVFKNMQ